VQTSEARKKLKKRFVIVGGDSGDDNEDNGKNEIKVYNRNVTVEEIIPLVVKRNRCKNLIPTLNISWTVIHLEMRTRSVDDIRNYWQLKLVPLLVPEAKLSMLSS
jgi:hypothetical protein